MVTPRFAFRTSSARLLELVQRTVPSRQYSHEYPFGMGLPSRVLRDKVRIAAASALGLDASLMDPVCHSRISQVKRKSAAIAFFLRRRHNMSMATRSRPVGAEIIDRAMLAAGVRTQGELAAVLGANRDQVSRWSTGQCAHWAVALLLRLLADRVITADQIRAARES